MRNIYKHKDGQTMVTDLSEKEVKKMKDGKNWKKAGSYEKGGKAKKGNKEGDK